MDERWNWNSVDLAVIGSGGAAMAAAIAARQAGKSVTLVEAGTLGGTCVNVGCVPSKTLLAAAGVRHAAMANPFPGAPTSTGPVDLAALVAQKDDLVGQLRQAKYADVAESYGVPVMTGVARFVAPDLLTVDRQPLRARAYLIATGAGPATPDLPGLHEVSWLTSTTAMELTELPESLIVIGGGYVGLEQAQLFSHLGTRVTVVGRIAPTSEPELAAVLRQAFADDGIAVLEEHAVAVEPGNPVMIVTRSGRRVRGERLLVAAGRRARTAALDLDSAAVKTDTAGFVEVDAHQRTSNPQVYAAVDVAGGPQYVYVAAATGRIAALNATGATPEPLSVDYTGLPGVIFTRPQLAHAGLTEAAARAAGHEVISRTLDLADLPRALANRDTRGAVKLVAEVGSQRLLGVHAAADTAGELMLAGTYAIKAGMTVDQIAETWAPYLTMAEGLRLAAGLFSDSDKPRSCCA
jgi:mercuric reductase